MARKIKKLKLDIQYDQELQDTRIHFDREDNLLAEEHYGFYIMSTLTDANRKNNPRIYLSYNHKLEYYKAKSKLGNIYYERIPKKAKLEVFNRNSKYLNLIKSILDKAFSKKLTYGKCRFILTGINIFISCLKKNEKEIQDIFGINYSDIILAYKYLQELKKVQLNDVKCLDEFFSAIDMKYHIANDIKKEIIINIKMSSKKHSIVDKVDKAMPSSVVYQLEMNIKKEYKILQHEHNEQVDWLKEYSNKNFMSKENILKTIFDYLMENRKKITSFMELLLLNLKYYHNIEASIIFDQEYVLNKMSEEELENRQNVIKKLEKISINGKNIDIKDEKHAFYWHKEILPLFPYDKSISNKYDGFRGNDLKSIRTWVAKYFNISLIKLDKKIYPSFHDIYPLYLLLLIKTGANQEVIKSLKVKCKGKVNYSLMADNIGIFTILDVSKKRSNSTVTLTLKNDSIEKKYLDLYIDKYQDMYKNSEGESLFQYINNTGGLGSKYRTIDNSFLANIKNSPSSFYKKYEILDLDGNRLNFIDHTSVRKSHNYQDFLNGKLEFERQLKKTHKSGDTTKTYYENQNFEWQEAKKHKIALAQNLVVGIFRGEITREEHKSAKLFEVGPMADCKDNKHPTFDNAPNIKDNEYCTDWTKCLTLCDKSCVIPKVHGPVIFAWIKYMDDRKEDFIREQDWEKEYLIDYQSAEDSIKYFTKEENDFCISERHKHLNFVQIKFSKTYKAKGEIHA